VRRVDGEYRWMLHHKLASRASDGGVDRVSISRIASKPKKNSRRALSCCKRNEFYLAEAQRLGHIGSWVFDRAAGSTTGRVSFLIYTVLIRKNTPLPLRNIWHASIRTIVNPWHR
jgi:hypothetical protein